MGQKERKWQDQRSEEENVAKVVCVIASDGFLVFTTNEPEKCQTFSAKCQRFPIYLMTISKVNRTVLNGSWGACMPFNYAHSLTHTTGLLPEKYQNSNTTSTFLTGSTRASLL